MKLLRIGSAGQEKPSILDNSGIRRDLSSVVDDIASNTLLPENIEALCNQHDLVVAAGEDRSRSFGVLE